MMRYLGIDYGDKRIGTALSDPDGKIAFPEETIANGKSAVSHIVRLAKREHAAAIVVGLPVSFGGKETEQTKKVRAFAEALSKKNSNPIVFENEVLTTRMARNEGISKKHVDSAAAALILQSYLDKQHT